MRLQRGAQALARARRRDIVTPSSPSPKRPKVAGSGMSRFENCAFISDMPSVMPLPCTQKYMVLMPSTKPEMVTPWPIGEAQCNQP